MEVTTTPAYRNALGIDFGEKRIGVARVSSVARLPEPLVTLANDDMFIANLRQLIEHHDIDLLVVGLPRSMSGTETDQTRAVRAFVADTLLPAVGTPVHFQDETLTSVTAESAYSPKQREKFGIDALAAAEILRSFVGAVL